MGFLYVRPEIAAGFLHILLAYKIRSSTKEMKDLVLDPSGYKALSEDFRWKSAEFETSVVVDGRTEHWTDHIILTWSAKRARKRGSERLIASASGMKSEMNKGGKKYVKVTLSEETSGCIIRPSEKVQPFKLPKPGVPVLRLRFAVVTLTSKAITTTAPLSVVHV